MNTAYLLLGSNKGDRTYFLSQAIELINKNLGNVIAKSSLYNTAPWPCHTPSGKYPSAKKHNQDDFLNQAICIEILFSASDLMENILSIEKTMGRTRLKKWEARTIDIDILFFNDDIIQTSKLIIPHPFLHDRRFALVPLAEITDGFIHPILKKTVKQLLSDCMDNLPVVPYTTIFNKKN